MFSSIIFFSALFFFVATALPLTTWSTCHPDFEGAAVAVSVFFGRPYPPVSWSVNPAVGSPVIGSTSSSKFLFQQNGDYDPTYTIKHATVNNLTLAVELNGGGLATDYVDWSGSDVNQKWKVECVTCITNISQQQGVVASGCTIASDNTDTGGFCVGEITPGRQLELAVCNQQFVFSV
ncbi:hypothetical protein EDD85DRAFT_1030013 [Armillaria nabsnona]|nr:hypothetical protein EDD85DRAFT_1030013 [Armillaria nabsnona]